MAASLVLAGRASGHKESTARETVERCIERYAAQMRIFAAMPSVEVVRFTVHRMNEAEPVRDALAKAERATPQHTLEQLTEVVPGEPGEPRCFKEQKPMLTRVTGAQERAVLASLGPYQEMLEPQRQHLLSLYRPLGVAFKVVGTGSVGLRDYCVYFEGNGRKIRCFCRSRGAGFNLRTLSSRCAVRTPQRQRVAEGQRAMQLQSDPFLGWTHMAGGNSWCGSSTIIRDPSNWRIWRGGLQAYAEVCGELLARGHARSGDPLVLAGYLGSGDGFAAACAKFGALYADQTEKDWQELKRSRRVGAKS